MTELHLHPPSHHQIDTGDPAVVQDFLSRSYGTTVRLDPPRADSCALKYSHGRTGVGLFATETITAPGTLQTHAERLTPAVVYLPRHGHVQCRAGGQIHDAGPGQVMLAQSTDDAIHTRTTDATLDTVVLDQSLLVDTAVAGGDLIRFTGHVPVDAAAAAMFTQTARFIADTVLDDPERATPLVIGAAARLLASAALAAFTNTTSCNGAPGSHHAAPATLRRAIDYIEANAHHDIGIAEIAGSIYLTPRSVQYIFRRYLDTTPTDYLRRVRLARAREDLRAADRSTTTVAAVAARWGFAHTGRFAVQFRKTFGESPHETLQAEN